MSFLPQLTPVHCKEYRGSGGTPLYYTGPDLNEGPLPAFFYFALAGNESLCLDPYNQPVAFLTGAPLRVFSMTLPGHSPGMDKIHAMKFWADELLAGKDIITPFVDSVLFHIEHLINKDVINPSHIAIGGLSRGSFLATHVAARNHHIKSIVAYAPLTLLPYHDDFASLAGTPLLQSLSLDNLTDQLIHKHLRVYIGNHDTCVGTRTSFDLTQKIVEAAFNKKIRSPQIEMIIGPSIGHKGHGTAPEVFYDGANWIKGELGIEAKV